MKSPFTDEEVADLHGQIRKMREQLGESLNHNLDLVEELESAEETAKGVWDDLAHEREKNRRLREVLDEIAISADLVTADRIGEIAYEAAHPEWNRDRQPTRRLPGMPANADEFNPPADPERGE